MLHCGSAGTAYVYKKICSQRYILLVYMFSYTKYCKSDVYIPGHSPTIGFCLLCVCVCVCVCDEERGRTTTPVALGVLIYVYISVYYVWCVSS